MQSGENWKNVKYTTYPNKFTYLWRCNFLHGHIKGGTTRRTCHRGILTTRAAPTISDKPIDTHLRHFLGEPLLRTAQWRALLLLSVPLHGFLYCLRGQVQPVADARLFRFRILPLQQRIVLRVQGGRFRHDDFRSHWRLVVGAPVNKLVVRHLGKPRWSVVEVLGPVAHLFWPPVGRFSGNGAWRKPLHFP